MIIRSPWSVGLRPERSISRATLEVVAAPSSWLLVIASSTSESKTY